MRPGRKPFIPTDDQRRMVESMAAYGIPQRDIRVLVINPTTGKPLSDKHFRKHFRAEILSAATRANAKVAESLYYQAVGRDAIYDRQGRQLRAELPPSVAAAIFWAKSRMKWSERAQVEWTGPDGGPIQTQEVASVNVYLPANNRDPAKQPAPRAVPIKSG